MAPVASGTGAVILLVDDDEGVRDFVADGLRAEGYLVHEASHGAQALRRLQADSTIDLMVVDLAMPGMTGTELVRQARLQRPGLAVLYMTGHAGDPMVDERDRLLAKPFRMAELAAAVAAALADAPDLARAK